MLAQIFLASQQAFLSDVSPNAKSNYILGNLDFFFAAFSFGTCGVGGVESIRFMTSRASFSASSGVRVSSDGS
jgi:hypothetical protein